MTKLRCKDTQKNRIAKIFVTKFEQGNENNASFCLGIFFANDKKRILIKKYIYYVTERKSHQS